jgi:MFS family permease
MSVLYRFSGGLRAYQDKISQFSPNARAVLTFSAMNGLVFGVFRLLFNFYVLSLGGYDERFVGNLTSYSSAAALMAALPAVYIADRFSQKRIMIVTGLISAAAILGMVLLPLPPVLITLNMVASIAAAIRQVTVSPFLMRNTTSEDRQYVFSLNFGLTTLFSAAGNQLGGFLPTWLGGAVGAEATSPLAYQLALGGMTLISFLAIGPLKYLRVAPRDPDAVIEMPWKKLARHGGALVKLITPQLVIGLGAGMFQPFRNLYFRKVFGLNDAAVGTVFFISVFAMAIAQFTSAPLADRFGKIRTVIAAQAVSIPFLIIMGLAAWIVPSGRAAFSFMFIVTAIAFLTRQALMNLAGPVYETFILDQTKPEAQSLASALNGISFQFGWVVSPSISGWFQAQYGQFGFVPVFACVVILYAAAIFMEWLFFHNVAKVPGPALADLDPADTSIAPIDDMHSVPTK